MVEDTAADNEKVGSGPEGTRTKHQDGKHKQYTFLDLFLYGIRVKKYSKRRITNERFDCTSLEHTSSIHFL